MLRKLSYGLPVLILVACGETPEKYRDTHHLELPPVLPIEHTNPQPAIASDDLKPKSVLASLMDFKEVDDKPRLTLKTNRDRAWEMVATALKVSNVEVLDKNQDDGHFRVRFDPDNTTGEEVSLIRALLNNQYAEGEYNIKLDDEISGVVVNAALTSPDSGETEDGSAQLIRLLHKVIDEKIINRPADKKPED